MRFRTIKTRDGNANVPRYRRSRRATRTRRTKKGCLAWRSIPSSRPTASSSSITLRRKRRIRRSFPASAFPRTIPPRPIPNSEEELLRIPQPFWNHNGGNMLFGPDGYLYIALGDGGSANDPWQRPEPEYAARLDLADRCRQQDPGKTYAIPKDNPFVGQSGAQPEIFAYGVRNIWGISYDAKTGLM